MYYHVAFKSHEGNIIKESKYDQDQFRLNDFHTYSVQWNESYVEWGFDGIQEGNYSLVDIGFPLGVELGVGGKGFMNTVPNEDVMENVAQSWNCSLLMIDYEHFFN